MLTVPIHPLPFTHGLACMCPRQLQRFYDDALEPFFAATAPRLVALKRVLPSPLVALIAVI